MKRNILAPLAVAAGLALTCGNLGAENDLIKILDVLSGGGGKSKEQTSDTKKGGERKSSGRIETLPQGIVIRCKMASQAAKAGDQIWAFVINDVRDSNNKLVFPAGAEVYGKVEEVSRGRLFATGEWKLMTQKRTYKFAATAGEARRGADDSSVDVNSFRQGLSLSRNDAIETGAEFVIIGE